MLQEYGKERGVMELKTTEKTENGCYIVTNRQIKRGDVYYVDFGSVQDTVGSEFAKRRPVLIIQNDVGNLRSGTTICLCLSTKCKSVQPYRVRIDDLSIIKRVSDICAEQVKTIDKCRLEDYLGNVGLSVMKEVDKALAISLGMVKENYMEQEEKIIDVPESDIEAYLGEQLSFWQNVRFRITILEAEVQRLQEEVESVLVYIEDTTYNASQGYHVYKVLRDKRRELRKLQRELHYLRKLCGHVDPEKMIRSLQDTIAEARMENAGHEKLRYVEEVMRQGA